MSSSSLGVLQDISFSFLFEWISTLSLVFGGCCSNALALEQLTSQYSNSGTLLTFCQFLLVSLYGLPKFVTLKPYPRLKPRRLPILPYLVQVLLFYGISLLNNAAFAYAIPMPVHIIFRSGGLVISMVLNWLLMGRRYINDCSEWDLRADKYFWTRRYTLMQVLSVLMVTAGVILTTVSASGSKPRSAISKARPGHESDSSLAYATGIAILTLALLLGGLLGIVSDKTREMYPATTPEKSAGQAKGDSLNKTAPWEESMFYLHFLAMPMFLFVRKDLVSQFRAINAGPRMEIPLPLPLRHLNSTVLLSPLAEPHASSSSDGLSIPAAYPPLLLNSITQLFCIAGVHRLTTRVSSLTVTLVLVIRKAVSLVISVLLFSAAGRAAAQDRQLEMWAGALLVFMGTVGYSLGTGQKTSIKDKTKTE
ncbi:uncharacterized protein FIBRA_06132 [Fibroporia radiculosa]|uniref:UAA transporter n=1 Tax=Fibroporia radiculosa TaxID=599839 RepID=J4IB36_9APHY|nr:uncharacterized protein FIBRA_06132 [Fibroporia radiculosa]CCM03976.1 predicted protein [Fibroporia radiculosa]